MDLNQKLEEIIAISYIRRDLDFQAFALLMFREPFSNVGPRLKKSKLLNDTKN